MAALVDLPAFKEFLRAANLPASDSPLATRCLNAAIGLVEDKIGPTDGVAVTERVYPSPGGVLALTFAHLNEAGTVTVTDPDGAVVVPYDVDYAIGTVRLSGWISTGRAWTVTATPATYGDQEALAILIVASHLYEIHRGRDTGNRGDFYDPAVDVVPSGFAFPRRAVDLLGLGGVVA